MLFSVELLETSKVSVKYWNSDQGYIQNRFVPITSIKFEIAFEGQEALEVQKMYL